MTHQLNPAERDAALQELGFWRLTDNGLAIERTFRFANFSEAFAFMTRVALAAEKLDHHPEWSNVWNRVEVRLTTHNAGGLTHRDVELARTIDELGANAQ